MTKNYIGISRDHSGSMRTLAKAAARDYNQTIQGIKEAAAEGGTDTIVSVVRFGSRVEREIVNSSVNALRPMPENGYWADMGMTALFDSVGELVSIFEATPDVRNTDVSFLLMAITDGEENHSGFWHDKIQNKIKELQKTDRWTFVFRVPRGYGSYLSSNFSIPEGNILEWDQTAKGVEEATKVTSLGMQQYYRGLKSGKLATTKFFTDLSNVTQADIKANLVDVSHKVSIWEVANGLEGASIRGFVEHKTGRGYIKGAAFYELVKPEKSVQDYKQIAIQDRKSTKVYGGRNARDMLGLPHAGDVRVNPGDHGNFRIFIQSTSTNRILPVGTHVLYWPDLVLGTATA